MTESLLKSRVVVDFSHVIFRNFFMNRTQIDELNEENPGTGFHYLKHLIYSSLFLILGSFKPTEMILALDDSNQWRKKVYPEYKAHRAKARKDDDYNWDEFFEFVGGFGDEIRQNLPFKVLKISRLEADDIAGWFARLEDMKTILVSSDKDWIQLLKYSDVSMFDPISKSFINCVDPVRELKKKILIGDKGDNIPAIRPRLGEKTAEKILNDQDKLGELYKKYSDTLKRNALLIDLKYTPKVFTERLEKEYIGYEFPMSDMKHLFSYFTKNKLRRLTDRIDEINGKLKCLDF